MNKVSETVVGTTENIKDGNEEIREVLIVLSLSLLDAFFAVLVNVEASKSRHSYSCVRRPALCKACSVHTGDACTEVVFHHKPCWGSHEDLQTP